MAGQTVSTLSNVLKEVWTADNLAKQFYAETPWLDRLEKTDRYTIGNVASVPLWTNRGGATTVLGPNGGNLNPVSYHKTGKGQYTLAYNWAQVQLEFGALNQATDGATSVIEAKLLEVEGAVSDLRRDISRQFFGNGDALIAQLAANTTQNTLNLAAGGYGAEAIVRGFLRPDQTIDIITPGSTDTALASNIQITAVNSATPSITVSGSALTTTTAMYVVIHGARSGNARANINESDGLRNIYGSATAIVGGIDPASNSYWAPAQVDTGTTTMALTLPLTLQQNVFQQSGQFPTEVVTGIKQLTNLYKLLQSQARFQGDLVAAGNVLKTQWNGMNIEAYPEASDREWYFIDPSNLLLVTGAYKTPVWASDVEGAGGQFRWNQGSTAFKDAIVYPVSLATRRRNSGAAAVGLTA